MARTHHIDTGTNNHSSTVGNDNTNPGAADGRDVEDFEKLLDEDQEQLSDNNDNPKVPDNIKELLLKSRDKQQLTPGEEATLKQWQAKNYPSLTRPQILTQLQLNSAQKTTLNTSPTDNNNILVGGVTAQANMRPQVQAATQLSHPNFDIQKMADMIESVRSTSNNVKTSVQTAEIQLKPNSLGIATASFYRDGSVIQVDLKLTTEQREALPRNSLEGLIEVLEERFGEYVEVNVEVDDSGQQQQQDHAGDDQQQRQQQPEEELLDEAIL